MFSDDDEDEMGELKRMADAAVADITDYMDGVTGPTQRVGALLLPAGWGRCRWV